MFQSLQKRLQNRLVDRQTQKNRLVTKDGHCNIEVGNVEYHKRFILLVDFWTTVVEIRWRYVIFNYVISFTGTWFGFALIWYWIGKNNGDLLQQNPPLNHTPCVRNVYGLTTAFLYSLETQTTIGYGSRYITGVCPSSVALIIIQTLMGTMLNCFMCSIILAKMSMPKKRAKSITFSKMAVICLKNGSLCLLIRVANLRKTLLIGSQIYGKLLRTTVTSDGETVILDQTNINFVVDAGKDNLFFVCPLTLYHIIDNTSPFFEMAMDTLHQQEFELVVFLDGVAESTSTSCQVRTSYIPHEIKWGYSFLPVISRTKEGKYCVDFSNFAKIVPVTTPHCAQCFHNEKAHNHQYTKSGIDNPAFEVIDIHDPLDFTKM
ncbi:ATP-sensitive inward rectifier potassium channel 1-like isoform X1 [Paramormyrops kingsleyae]|uniref:ATP-sensitive inward rectifier potassium channel 1-like isoform X1 n=1 Tax=Paramormyrops kingsleyae TaxID=1676925 RepID=UPI003B9751C4